MNDSFYEILIKINLTFIKIIGIDNKTILIFFNNTNNITIITFCQKKKQL